MTDQEFIIAQLAKALANINKSDPDQILANLGYAHLSSKPPENDKMAPRINLAPNPAPTTKPTLNLPSSEDFRCHKCDSDNIDEDNPEVASDWRITYSRAKCLECDHSWDNVFVFAGQYFEALDCDYEDLALNFLKNP